MYQPIFSLKTGWIVGVIDNHIAKPLTEEEVTQVCNRINSFPLEAVTMEQNGGIDFADKEIRHILGRPCFQFIGWAQAIRKLGYPLARKAEEEQALGIYYLLWLYGKHKDKYWEFANVDSEMKLFIEQLSRFSD